jgi:hypothetical protein
MFDEHQQTQELTRLRMFLTLFDPATIRHLQATGPRLALSLGAGAGSIMKWMVEVVGAGGRVVR